MLNRIRYKIALVVGVTVSLALIATGLFYTRQQERAVLAQNERTMSKLTESVIRGLQSVMLAGSADIAQSYADRLKQVPEVSDFSIMRTDGLEAFRDNTTIESVNRRRGEELFPPRQVEREVRLLAPDDAELARALVSAEPLPVYGTSAEGERTLTFLAPIANQEACYKCHGSTQPVRGVLRLTTSLAPVERDVLAVRQQSMVVVGVALMATMLLTGFMMGRSIVRPIERVTHAMARVSGGDLEHRVPVAGRDELGRMADSFNTMTEELQRTYDGLRREQDKLTTIIHSAGEGIVVTDGAGQIVLVNPAAERLLEKSTRQIGTGGLMQLLDDPDAMARALAGGADAAPTLLRYRERALQVFASTIHDGTGQRVGSAALLRDVTEEKRLEETLRQLSQTDGLTGLYNRRHLDDALAREFERARRGRQPLALAIGDVDHFKRFNDEHGHEQGDRVLKAVAEILRADLRRYDLPCRYGGEEFVLILPGIGSAPAQAVAERVRARIEASRVDGLRVTISLGVAAYPDCGADDPAALLVAADAALYRAKAEGRNRVHCAEAVQAAPEPA